MDHVLLDHLELQSQFAYLQEQAELQAHSHSHYLGPWHRNYGRMVSWAECMSCGLYAVVSPLSEKQDQVTGRALTDTCVPDTYIGE